MSLTKKKPDKPSKLTNKKVLEEPIHLSFRYLTRNHPHGFSKTYSRCVKKKSKEFFSDFEDFIDLFYQYGKLDDVLADFGSHKGNTMMEKSKNEFVANLIRHHEKAFPDNLFGKNRSASDKKLIHLHLKRNGKGAGIIYGQTLKTTFYVLGFDPFHESC